MSDSDLFERARAEIEDTYARLGHSLGWRFLFSPRATLSARSRMMLVGLNPAGSTYLEPTASSEEGNLFALEGVKFGSRNDKYPRNVRAMYEVLAEAMGGGARRNDLLDETLTSNLCPFRSPDFPSLHRRRESLAFSRRLWSGLCAHLAPRAVFCLGVETGENFRAFFGADGQPGPERRLATDWGVLEFRWQSFRTPRGDVTVYTIPHLSYYSIFSSAKCEAAAREFMAEVAERLAGER